jgi:hypothetical protein
VNERLHKSSLFLSQDNPPPKFKVWLYSIHLDGGAWQCHTVII